MAVIKLPFLFDFHSCFAKMAKVNKDKKSVLIHREPLEKVNTTFLTFNQTSLSAIRSAHLDLQEFHLNDGYLLDI
jgi:hypothetical protein